MKNKKSYNPDEYTYEDYLKDFEFDYLGFDGILDRPVPGESTEKLTGNEAEREVIKADTAQNKDIDSLVELRISYLQEDFGSLSSNDIDAIRKKLPDYFASHLGNDLFCYVIRSKKRIVSCAFLLIIEKPMSPAFINGKTGILLNVYTVPAFRHNGYAGMIMKKILADAKEMELCTIELKATDAGYPLYRSVGFHDDVSHYHFMKWDNR